jgi:hypothetical protein
LQLRYRNHYSFGIEKNFNISFFTSSMSICGPGLNSRP